MKMHGTAIRTLTLAVLTLPWTFGCGGSSSATTASSSNVQKTPAADSENSKSNSATMIADGAESEPAQCVAIFLDSLRKGDERAANGVLTQLAREELAKTAYVIQPLGTPAGQYKIGRVGFPYEEKTVALVECTWTEPPSGGQPEEVMDIVCEVHQGQEGWRIAGVALTIPGTDQALVLDFEDAASLQATIDAATGQTPQQQASQIATDATGGQVGLPAYPSQGIPGNTYSEPAAFPQIALPPLDNAPINR